MATDKNRNRFHPPGEQRGRSGEHEYPDVVGEGKKAERGLSAPTRKDYADKYPMIVGAVGVQKRAADRAVAKLKWKPPVDNIFKSPIHTVPEFRDPDKYNDPKPEIKIPPVMNDDGTVWTPPDDSRIPRPPRTTYPSQREIQRIGLPTRYRPPSPNSDWGYHSERGNIPESAKQYYRNCLGMTGEGLRTLLEYNPDLGTLTWIEGSGPRSGHHVRKDSECVVRIAGFQRNVYGVIFLMVLNRLPTGWVQPADHEWSNWCWENIRPSERNPC